MNSNRMLVTTAAAGLVTLVTALAAAGDAKVFPGTMCRQEGTSSSSINYDANGRIQNTSASPVTVICPIARDSTTSTWASINVVVADRSQASNVTCRAATAQADGLGWWKSPTNPIPAGAVYLNWWEFQDLSIGTNGADERDNGTYYIECTLPGSNAGNLSGVDSYRIDEN